jgi:transcriptional regulator with XRE-family HTH domain
MDKYLFLRNVGLKVKQIRSAKGVSITELASMCDMDRANFSRFENGQKNAHIHTLKIIADKLDVDIKDFL